MSEWMNEKIKMAMREVMMREFEDIPEEEEIEWEFSPSFEKKMRRLIRQQRRPYWKLINSAGKRVAILVLAIIISTSSLMAVEAVRTPVIGFFMESYDDFIRIFSGEKAPQDADVVGMEVIYAPAYIPDGYEKVNVKNDRTMIITTWENAEGSLIRLKQILLSGNEVTFDNKNVTAIKRTFGSKSVIIYRLETSTIIYWNETDVVLQLSIIGQEIKEIDIEKIVVSIIPDCKNNK